MKEMIFYPLLISMTVILATNCQTIEKDEDLRGYHKVVRRAFSFGDLVDDVKDTLDSVEDAIDSTIDDLKDSSLDDVLSGVNNSPLDDLIKNFDLDKVLDDATSSALEDLLENLGGDKLLDDITNSVVDDLLEDLGLDKETLQNVKELLNNITYPPPNVTNVTEIPSSSTYAPDDFTEKESTKVTSITDKTTTTSDPGSRRFVSNFLLSVTEFAERVQNATQKRIRRISDLFGQRGDKINATTTPVGRRLIRDLLTPVMDFVNRLRNVTENAADRILDMFEQRVEKFVTEIETKLEDRTEVFVERLSSVVLGFISNLTVGDMELLEEIENNRTREFVDNYVKDILPILVRISFDKATFEDLRCAITESELRDQLDSLFKDSQISLVITDLMLLSTKCRNASTTNNAINQATLQAMTQLMKSRNEVDVSAVTSLFDTLSFANPSMTDPSKIIQQLTDTLTSTENNGTPDTDFIIPDSLIDILSNGDENNALNSLASNLLASILDPLPLNDDQTEFLTNQLAKLIAPAMEQARNRVLTFGGNFNVSGFSTQLGSRNPQDIMRALISQNGSLSSFLPSQLIQALELLSTVREAGAALSDIYSDGFNTSQRCRLERSTVGEGLQAFQPWALLFLDSLGKPGTGILQGNTYFVGNFDQCSEVRNVMDTGDVIEGHYVKYKFRVPMPPGFPDFSGESLSLQEAGLPFVIWGVCLPRGCNYQDARTVGQGVADGLNIDLVSSDILVDQDPSGDAGFICTMLILGILGFFCVIGTFVDLTSTQPQEGVKAASTPKLVRSQRPVFTSTLSEDPATLRFPTGEQLENQPTFRDLRMQLGTFRDHESLNHTSDTAVSEPRSMTVSILKFFVAFSIPRNTQQIMNAKHTPGDITCLHGIRVISISWVILGHVYFFAPNYGNMTALLDMSSWWTFNAIRNATYTVDTFFLLSGCLVSYLFLKTAKKTGGVKPILMVLYYVNRYLRLTPLLGLAMLFYATVTPYLEYGPFQRELYDRESTCKEKWWWNILYINNLFTDSISCMGWTWYLPNDMQFYVVAPLVIVPLAVGYTFVGIFIALLQIACHIIMFTVMEEKYDATLTENGLDYFAYIYIKPYTRCGPYAIGLLLGYILFKTKFKVKLHRFVVVTGWLLAWAGGLTLVFITHDNYKSGVLDPRWSIEVSKAYEIVARPLWALCVAWMVFACSTGYGGVINTILSWRAWIPLSRLTYGVYLFHVMVTHYFNNNRRTLAYFTKEFVIEQYLAVFIISYALAFVASILIETPIRNLTKPTSKGKSQTHSTSMAGQQNRHINLQGKSAKKVSFHGEPYIIRPNAYSGLTPTSPPAPESLELPTGATTNDISIAATQGSQNQAAHGTGEGNDEHSDNNANNSNIQRGPQEYPNLAYVTELSEATT